MEMRQLLALVTVANCGSFTKASDELSLTQSAVTRQIAALENETRARLFDRLGRTVVLTSAGKVLHHYAVEMIRLENEAVHALEDVREGTGGKLAVGASSTAAAYLLPPLLHIFRQDRPRVDLSVFTGPSGRVAEMVRSNAVDVGLLMDKHGIEGLRSIKVAEYSIALIVYPDHAMAHTARAPGQSVRISELTELPLILMQKGASLRRSADLLLDRAQHPLNISMELDNVEAIKKMIEARLGVSLLPRMSVKSEIVAGTLCALPIESSDLPNPAIVVVHRPEKYVSGAMRTFIDLLRSGITTD